MELTTKKKDAEDRLWRAYKDSEARERAQRRELHKLEKVRFNRIIYIDLCNISNSKAKQVKSNYNFGFIIGERTRYFVKYIQFITEELHENTNT